MENKAPTKRSGRIFAAIVFLFSLAMFFGAYLSPSGSNGRTAFMVVGTFMLGIVVIVLFVARSLMTHKDRSIHRQEHTLRKADGECDILHKELH
jgi:hypothetical protein